MTILAHAFVEPAARERSSWIYFLHGIFGAGRNWASVARRLTRERREWGGVLVDLRLHGESQEFDPPHTLEACARDVGRLAEALAGHAPPTAMLGHSFGGKVALALLQTGPARSHQVWVVDSSPEARPHGGAAATMLEALGGLPGPFDSRETAIRGLEARGFDRFVAAWMATNLEREEEGFRWRFELPALESLVRDFFRVALWSVVEEPPPGVVLHFVKANASEVMSPATCQRLEAAGRRTGRVHLHRVAGGHWVNADNPDALLDLLVAQLPASEP